MSCKRQKYENLKWPNIVEIHKPDTNKDKKGATKSSVLKFEYKEANHKNKEYLRTEFTGLICTRPLFEIIKISVIMITT